MNTAKKFIVSFLVLSVAFTLFPQKTTSAEAVFASGNGTEGTPYMVNDCVQLQRVGNYVTSYFELVGDIDCAATNPNDPSFDITLPWHDHLGFNPIGFDAPFTGHFDGKGFKIKNLFINRPTETAVGLFGNVSGSAEIKNFTMENGSITGALQVGSLAGNITGSSLVLNVTSNLNVTAYYDVTIPGSGEKVGGLVGYVEDSLLDTTSFSGTVTGLRRIGGLIGYVNNCTLNYSHNSSPVSGEYLVGGLIGGGNSTNINYSYNTAKITGTYTGPTENKGIGGLIGSAFTINIDSSYNTGMVKSIGTLYLGGLAGSGYWITLTKSYNAGYVNGDSATHTAGGLIGASLTANMSDCYNHGNVKGFKRVGGLIGFAPEIDFYNSYNSGSVTATFTAEDTNTGVGGLVGVNSVTGFSGPFSYANSIQMEGTFNVGTTTGVTPNGGLIGSLGDIDSKETYFSNNWWFNTQTNGIGNGEAIGWDEQSVEEYDRANSADVFKNTSSNAPMYAWNFNDEPLWRVTDAYPVLMGINAVDVSQEDTADIPDTQQSTGSTHIKFTTSKSSSGKYDFGTKVKLTNDDGHEIKYQWVKGWTKTYNPDKWKDYSNPTKAPVGKYTLYLKVDGDISHKHIETKALSTISNAKATIDWVNKSIKLTWDISNPSALKEVKIYRSTIENFTPTASTLIGTNTPTDTNFFMNSVHSWNNYYYKIVSYDINGKQIDTKSVVVKVQ